MSGRGGCCGPVVDGSGTGMAAAGESAAGPGDEPLSPKTYPLRDVVADCVRRWFITTLKAAQGGDTAMQLLVGEMYCSGYGVSRNLAKGKFWLKKAGVTDRGVGNGHIGMSGSERTGSFFDGSLE